MRLVFMGTPEFAVPSLSILIDAGYEIAGVITSVDKTGGRGRNQLIESAVKRFAVTKGLHILQPKNLKDTGFISELAALKADLQVVVAFRMLPEVVWNMPPLGTMNLHGSLLPAYRGAAPINWAIIKGEKETGVTSFMLQHAIDTGDILLQRTLDIGPDDTAGDLHDSMMIAGAQLVLESMQMIESGNLNLQPQPEQSISSAPKLTHELCRIEFSQSVADVHNFIRGLSPFPTAWTILDGMQLNVYQAAISENKSKLDSGTIRIDQKHLEIACGDGMIRLVEVQLQGKRRMSVSEFLNGYRISSASVGS